MDVVFPDTDVVIGRIKEKDALHPAAVDALGRYPGNSIKLLIEVYKEASENIQKNALRAVQHIEDAYTNSFGQKATSAEISIEDLERIIKKARQLSGGRSEGYYGGLLEIMRGWLVAGENPFLSLDKILRITMMRELSDLDNVFGILSPASDIIHYTTDEVRVAEEIRKTLKQSDAFFVKNKTERDLLIAGQMLTAASRDEYDNVVALMNDDDFAKAFERILKSPNEEFRKGASKVSVDRLTHRR